MALSYTAETSEGGATAVASLVTTLLNTGTGLYVAGYVDGTGVARSFIPSAVAQATSADEASKWFPQVSQLSVVVSSPGGSNDGPIKLVLVSEAADEINSSSVMTVLLDRFATVITVTGTFA